MKILANNLLQSMLEFAKFFIKIIDKSQDGKDGKRRNNQRSRENVSQTFLTCKLIQATSIEARGH